MTSILSKLSKSLHLFWSCDDYLYLIYSIDNVQGVTKSMPNQVVITVMFDQDRNIGLNLGFVNNAAIIAFWKMSCFLPTLVKSSTRLPLSIGFPRAFFSVVRIRWIFHRISAKKDYRKYLWLSDKMVDSEVTECWMVRWQNGRSDHWSMDSQMTECWTVILQICWSYRMVDNQGDRMENSQVTEPGTIRWQYDGHNKM